MRSGGGGRRWRRRRRERLALQMRSGRGMQRSATSAAVSAPARQQGAQQEIGAEQQTPRPTRDQPDRRPARADARPASAWPRQCGDRSRLAFGLNPAQRLVEVALDHLQAGDAAGRVRWMPWKPSARQACISSSSGVVDQRIGLGAVELLEEAHAADALAEERLSMLYCVQTCRSSVGMCCTMSSAVAQSTYLADWPGARRYAGRPDLALELLDRVGDLLHQACEGGAHQRDAQPAEQQQQRPGGPHDRVGVRRL